PRQASLALDRSLTGETWAALKPRLANPAPNSTNRGRTSPAAAVTGRVQLTSIGRHPRCRGQSRGAATISARPPAREVEYPMGGGAVLPFRICTSLLIAVVCLSLGFVRAEDDPRSRTDIDKELAERLYRESQARQGCKVEICETARKKETEGGNIACKVVKTWPAIDLKEKILKGKLDWPWGNAQCEANLSLARELIIAAMAQPKFEAKVGKHQVQCHLEAKNGQDAQTVQFTIDPVVNFENGKA